MHTKSLNANEMIQLNAMPCNHEAVNGTDCVYIALLLSTEHSDCPHCERDVGPLALGDSRDQVICEGAEPPRDPVWSSGDTSNLRDEILRNVFDHQSSSLPPEPRTNPPVTLTMEAALKEKARGPQLRSHFSA